MFSRNLVEYGLQLVRKSRQITWNQQTRTLAGYAACSCKPLVNNPCETLKTPTSMYFGKFVLLLLTIAIWLRGHAHWIVAKTDWYHSRGGGGGGSGRGKGPVGLEQYSCTDNRLVASNSLPVGMGWSTWNQRTLICGQSPDNWHFLSPQLSTALEDSASSDRWWTKCMFLQIHIFCHFPHNRYFPCSFFNLLILSWKFNLITLISYEVVLWSL